MTGSARRASHPPRRLWRLLLGKNELRRPCDRIEGLAAALLAAAFLIAAVTAACFAGHLYQSWHAAAAHARPAAMAPPRPGTLATVTAPAIPGAAAGTSVRAWLDRRGQPAASPASTSGMVVAALFADLCVTAAAAVVLLLCYLWCRVVLDRHRLAKWESAWAAAGPRWTSHR
jgi:hypothetical protein